MRSISPAVRLLPFALTLGALGSITPAWADGDPTTDTVPRVLAYQGVLEVDGRPLDASGDDALHITFALYDGADAEQPVYRQDIRVEVYTGRFTANIGPVGLGPDDAEVPIEQTIAAADDLYLGMTLLGDPEDPADDVPLTNRQRIHASPYSMWTTSATDLSVARDLVIGGDLEVRGEVRLPEGALTGREIADRTLRIADIEAAGIGQGLVEQGEAIAVDDAYLDDRIRSWVRANCSVRLGWRNGCNNCQEAPFKDVTVRADGVCTAANGADTSCRDNGNWGGVNTDGSVDTNDVFYIRLFCD